MRGFQGIQGFQGNQGFQGTTGVQGTQGFQGNQGLQGVGGAAAEFFAVMPPDNAATVAAGAAVAFPENGSNTALCVVRLTSSLFQLSNIGTYEVSFQVSVTEAGQLQLDLNSFPLGFTVVGRATGTSKSWGQALVTTTTINSTLSVINPSGESSAFVCHPVGGRGGSGQCLTDHSADRLTRHNSAQMLVQSMALPGVVDERLMAVGPARLGVGHLEPLGPQLIDHQVQIFEEEREMLPHVGWHRQLDEMDLLTAGIEPGPGEAEVGAPRR